MKINFKQIKTFLFWLLLFLLYYLILPNFFAALVHKGLKSSNFWILNLSELTIYVGTFLIILLILRKDIFKQFKEFKKSPKKFLNKGFSYWMYGIIVMIISNLIVTSIVGGLAVNEQTARDALLKTPLYAIPSIVFIGPFLEEVIFRYSLRKSFKNESIYALTSAFIFGLLHVLTAIDSFTISGLLAHASEFLFIIPYGSLGFFFAKAYYETDNIFTTIIPHILHNSFSVILIIIANIL